MTGRSAGEVWKAVWQNLKQSFNRGPVNDICVGKDHYGNRYFERMGGKSTLDAPRSGSEIATVLL